MPETVVSLENNLRWFFPTPVVAQPWPGSEDINAALRELILSGEAQANPDLPNVVGGWATTKDFLTWNAECIAELREHIRIVVSEVVKGTSQITEVPNQYLGFEAWANVLRSGGYHRPHTHDNSFWSGVYYVASGQPTGDQPQNGQLELFDPRSAAGAIRLPGSTYQHTCPIDPQPGLIVMFPGWIRHMVHPFQGEGERISVAFNLIRT
jgi:uncharacterized protein (TIGR02466 family)